MTGLGAHYQVDVRCKGDLAATLGYLVDIQEIDRATRSSLVPAILAAVLEHPEAGPGTVLAGALTGLSAELQGLLDSVRWWLSPYYSVEVCMGALGTVLIRQRFDFAAAHRLHVASISDEENRRLFGKCNYPGGHGHNYQVEPCIAAPASAGRPAVPLAALEQLVVSTVIDRFDHRNLNTDCAEFRSGDGLNPSVENIAKVCFELLAPEIARAFPGADLRHLTVWESDRTSSTYPG